MEMKSEHLELQESQKSMEDQDQMTLDQRILKRKGNEESEKNPKLLWIRKRPPAPPHPRYSPEYMQVLIDQVERNKRSVRKTDKINDEANSCSLKKAQELQMKLAPEMPSFVKFMLPSHVSSCFWLRIPGNFCKLNIPKKDCSIMLVDESGEEYKTKFLGEKGGLSGGWKRFSTAHDLVEGDSVVFQLIEATKFKVYIIGKNGLPKCSQVAGDLALEKEILTDNADEGACSLSVLQESNHNDTPPGSVSNPGHSEEVGSEDLEGIRSATTIMKFKDVKSFEDFTIIVNDWNIDSELSEHVRAKYYELCCSQKAFLHDNLSSVINCKLLIAGIISGVVNVAEFIRSCKLNTNENDFTNWRKCLDGFEKMGMNVGFLHARLHQLENLAFKSEGAKDSKIYNEAVSQRTCLVEEIRKLELKLLELKEVHASKDGEIRTLKLKAKRHEMKFQAKVNDPW
ncbi:B3 domain-containing protein Os01g0234100-like [Telopea speciosissima]|uniref:B3 domain-containing protein Os01g0234100-like n=1 Tax=Telopea speciosissima TaxID=54955 RepID=UPI001CC8288E|nr:B3 domain-containing protein Os01g0234100-like [Telopea speciosissima]